MLTLFRRTALAAFACLALGGPIAAQDAVPDSAPAIRDFKLLPKATPQPEQEPRIAPLSRPPVVAVPLAPPPTEQAPADQPRPAPRATKAVTPPAPAAKTRIVKTPPKSLAAAEATAPTRAAPADKNPAQAPVPAARISRPTEVSTPAMALPEAKLPMWVIWGAAGLAIVLVVAGLLVFSGRRRRTQIDDREVLAGVVTATERPSPAPARLPAEAEPEAPPEAAPQRPWVEIGFRPASVSATGDAVRIDYELVLTNAGAGEAHNVRGTARIFSAGPEQDRGLAAFFAESVEPLSQPRILAPGESVTLKQALLLPGDEIVPVEIAGRSLLIPLVAFNVRYEYGEGESGQTALSFVVGRRPQPPAEKMAPIRLDLGPRVYRQLAKREHELRRVA